MATLTPLRPFTSGETLTPTKLNDHVSKATISGIVNTDVSATAAIADSKLATISTAGKVSASAITSGNLSLTGNATITGLTTINGNLAVSGIVSGAIPAGAVMPFAMNSAPSGWVAADGSNVNRATFAKLFSAIGTLYGTGDGGTTFTLPDLRGYFVRGAGKNGDGTSSGEFGADQHDAIQNITGKIDLHSQAGFNVSTTGAFYSSEGNTSTLVKFGEGSAEGDYSFDASRVVRTATETRPSNIAMLFCIKT